MRALRREIPLLFPNTRMIVVVVNISSDFRRIWGHKRASPKLQLLIPGVTDDTASRPSAQVSVKACAAALSLLLNKCESSHNTRNIGCLGNGARHGILSGQCIFFDAYVTSRPVLGFVKVAHGHNSLPVGAAYSIPLPCLCARFGTIMAQCSEFRSSFFVHPSNFLYSKLFA